MNNNNYNNSREIRRAITGVVVAKLKDDATVDAGILRREITRVLLRKREKARLLVRAQVPVIDVLEDFIRASIVEPKKIAVVLGSIKAPTVESQQFRAIQDQVQNLKYRMNI